MTKVASASRASPVMAAASRPYAFLSALVGGEVVGGLVVDGIDRRERHELGDLDRPRRLALEVLELFRREDGELVLAHIEAAHQLAAVDDALVGRAVDLLLDAAAA
jgi:hypothetical protein